MKSFAILRTNVGLTTNIKIMVDTKYNLTLDSIDSKEELSNTKYKKVPFIKKNYYDELIAYFYDGLPADTAFHIKFEEDVDTMADDFALQYDELYQYGARNITNNKNYSEEFEYFAPLYISPGKLPKYFIIFRVDGPGISITNAGNIKSQVFDKFKTVKVFDLRNTTPLGEWLDLNFNNNSFFPPSPLEIVFEDLEFSKWNGIDYTTGGYASRSLFLNTYYELEKEIFEFEKFVFDGFKNNKLVFPNILNFSFLFDDTPASGDNLRKWSINRYYGFYLEDMEKVTNISPYITPFLKPDVIISSGNYLESASGDPFVEGYIPNKIYYVEYKGEYYRVEKVIEQGEPILQNRRVGRVVTSQRLASTVTRYKIISEIDLAGKQSEVNKNFGIINSENKIINYDISYFQIDTWDSAHIWLIEIDGLFHNLSKDTDGSIVVFSDYKFDFNENDFTYTNNSSDATFTKKVNFIVDFNNPPKKFTIYKLNLTDIKDFDDRIIDTEYSKYEYEKLFDLTETDETKMYLVNLLSNSLPKDYDDFVFKGEVVNIPVSSEYTANYETFKIENDELSEIWRKNPVSCRWVYQNSLSTNDYPYLLNNSLVFEDYNRTVNPFDPVPQRIERNLDYFYTINSSTSSYIHHTLHIEDFTSNKNINLNYEFELDKYLNLGTYSMGTQSATYSFDYFTYFFERKTYFLDGRIAKNVKKYSLFNTGDSSIANSTVFRGIKFLIYELDNSSTSSVRKDETGKIDVLNLRTSNLFDGYKFSIILTDNEQSVTDAGGITSSVNTMTWNIFDDWKMDKTYKLGDIVVMDDIIYQSISANNITKNPVKEYPSTKFAKSAPYNQTTKWSPYIVGVNQNIFYSPILSYPTGAVDYSGTSPGIVYNNGDYYYYAGGTDDFWNPTISDSVGYPQGAVVLFKEKYYMSMTSSNHQRPEFRRPFIATPVSSRTTVPKWQYFWTATQSTSPTWLPIQLWNPSTFYPQLTGATYVVHNDVVWKTTSGANIPYGSETGNEPGVSPDWKRVYSLVPDTNIIYSPTNNSIIEINDSYYQIVSNTTNSTLECGINIYINKKWKNVLININISDNTTLNLTNTDRDLLYNELNKKLTAVNFINCINDISNKYGFTDYINYIIIEEDGKISKYNFDNIDGLPYIILCETPNEVVMKYDSINWTPISLPRELKPTKVLTTGINNNLSNLNDFNKIPVAAEIKTNLARPTQPIFYHSSKNIIEDIIYRFTGYYMPLFYDLQLFSKDFFTSSIGNYKFDTSLTEFGITKERKIRKVNRKGSVLKLRDKKDIKSIYPMVDEFGYTSVDFFIFKSSWDLEYYFSTEIESLSTTPTILSPAINLGNSLNVGQPVSNQNLNDL